MSAKIIHSRICGKAIKEYSFSERMSKLRRHRKYNHPKAFKLSIRKALRTKHKRGVIK